ncbi:restriction endonuclease subunit S [Empedobacter falsenii]
MTKTTQYKNTLIGPIPTEWEVKKLGEEFNVTMGQSPNSQFYNTEGIGLPLIQGNADIVDGKSIIRFYTSQITKTCEKDELIFTVRAPVGEMGIASYVSCLGRGVCSIKHSNSDSLNYIKFYLESYKDNWSKLSQGSTFEAISGNELKQFSFPLPPLPEQQKIAEVLSTWDKAIQETDAIIKKLEARNKALAFSLLTGKKRVKGFENEWRNTNFGEITKKISRRNKDLINAEVYSVTNSKGFVLQSDHFEGKVAGEDLSNYKVIKKNEFAYNPARINVGSLAYFEDEIGVISSLYVCFKTTEDVLDFYLLQYLQTEYVNSRINALGEGGVRIYLWYELFSKIKISLPSIEEQNAIAEILNTANQEVKQYQQKLEALKLQKKGLMQQLLTGKVRTV